MKQVLVRAKPSSSRNEVEKLTDTEYIVRTTAPPVRGLANRAIIELLAEYFTVPVSQVAIISGRLSRRKTIAINGIR